METPNLDETNERARKVAKTPWRVDLEQMKGRVASVEYIHPESIPHGTVAIVMLDNGYALQGWSAPADPDNFNADLGKQYAFEDAMRKMWALEAYVMRDAMAGFVQVVGLEHRWEVI